MRPSMIFTIRHFTSACRPYIFPNQTSKFLLHTIFHIRGIPNFYGLWACLPFLGLLSRTHQLYFRIWQSGHKPSAGNLFPVHGIRFTSWYPASHIMRMDKKTSLIRLQLFFLSPGMMVAKHVFMQQNARPLLYVITDKPPPTTKLTHKETSCTKQRRLRKRLLLMMTSLQAAGLP